MSLISTGLLSTPMGEVFFCDPRIHLEIQIGHFRITSGLFFEASLAAHPFKCKSVFIHMKMSSICVNEN